MLQYMSANGAVADGITGLTWQQSVPANPCRGDGAGGCTFADAESYCSGLSLAGYSSGWRLPTAAELYSLLDTTSGSPAIDQTVFPDTPPRWFWTSSLYVGRAGAAWVV